MFQGQHVIELSLHDHPRYSLGCKSQLKVFQNNA
jgi:hypothetical protein